MDEKELTLNVLTGIFGGLIVLEGSFITENINNLFLKIIATNSIIFLLAIIFIKLSLRRDGHN
ncbi:MAG: hypothetical protein J4472_02040 [DPANN group archaeon]|nr:hypothetical protein [DPANN group archaeon]